MRVLSFILLSLTASLTLAISTANSEVEKRQLPLSLGDVLGSLQNVTNGIIPQIGALTSSGTPSDSTVAPVLTGLIGNLTSTGSTITSIANSGTPSDVAPSAAASTVAGVISGVSGSLSGLTPFESDVPVLAPLLGAVDAAINGILIGLSAIITSILILVAAALIDVEAILRTLGLTLILATLGL